jgi:hypothetical protein
MQMKKYEVIVGNIGTVYQANSLKDALKRFREYRRQSKTLKGRAGGESVTLMCEGEPIETYLGHFDLVEMLAGE